MLWGAEVLILKFEYIVCWILSFDKRINRLNPLILIMGFKLLGINLCSSHEESKFHPLGFPAMSLAMWLANNGLGFSLHPAASNVFPILIFCSEQQCPAPCASTGLSVLCPALMLCLSRATSTSAILVHQFCMAWISSLCSFNSVLSFIKNVPVPDRKSVLFVKFRLNFSSLTIAECLSSLLIFDINTHLFYTFQEVL